MIIIIISTVQWIVDGKNNFTGPLTGMGMDVLEAAKSRQNEIDGAWPTKDSEDGK
jgi:hypothetical protein